MLSTLLVVLFTLWVAGVLTSNTFGGFIHLLLVAGAAVILIRILLDRRPLRS